MKEIKVTVAGLTAVGKSTVAAILADALYKAGFSRVAVNDIDTPIFETMVNLDRKIEAVREANVIIDVVQLNRDASVSV